MGDCPALQSPVAVTIRLSMSAAFRRFLADARRPVLVA
jgi:hypothetical protein